MFVGASRDADDGNHFGRDSADGDQRAGRCGTYRSNRDRGTYHPNPDRGTYHSNRDRGRRSGPGQHEWAGFLLRRRHEHTRSLGQ
jgi:hypothetical protein